MSQVRDPGAVCSRVKIGIRAKSLFPSQERDTSKKSVPESRSRYEQKSLSASPYEEFQDYEDFEDYEDYKDFQDYVVPRIF